VAQATSFKTGLDDGFDFTPPVNLYWPVADGQPQPHCADNVNQDTLFFENAVTLQTLGASIPDPTSGKNIFYMTS
jgi:hypothetical protein